MTPNEALLTDVKEEVKAILLAALRNTDCYLFLFGSQASKKRHWHSDFDVGILAEKSLDFALLSRLKGYMEAVFYPVDVVDFYHTREDFRNIALRHVEVWKKPEHPEKFKFQLDEKIN